MRPSECVGCTAFPCDDVDHRGYAVPGVDVPAEDVRIVLVSEASPPDPADGYYADGAPLFARTTLEAFGDAGQRVSTIRELLDLGVYLTTAVKCAKTGYAIRPATVDACAEILERELALFPDVRAYLAMGDVAIRALNTVARRAGEPRPVPAGSTYRIRGGTYTFRGARVFPSYLQAGPSFYIEKTKRRAIADDIGRALELAR